jgi:NADPH-dependent 2,4-dienoyl-CoA reductase/sulfur reductase-like enzyme
LKRREFLAAAAAAALPLSGGAADKARVVVVGGGFGGASCARALKRANANLDVTLVASSAVFTACPRSNGVVAGLRDIREQEFGYDALARDGIRFVRGAATAVDATTVRTAEAKLAYDRLVLAPGVAMRWNALRGYDEAASARMPHAWQAGAQTLLLRKQLEAMPDGGLVVIAVPAYPYRCPTAPYERASLVASYQKERKPRCKVLILDAKDGFTQQRLFEEAWSTLYPGMVEWVALSQGGAVISVDASANVVETDFDRHKAAVANVIPPQKAGAIAEQSGITDSTGWCPIDAATFESKLVPRVHVIGDAAIAGALPKSGFAAASQGKACALAVASLLADKAPPAPQLVNACYSELAPDYGISLSSRYHVMGGQIVEIPGSLKASEPEATRAERARNAELGAAAFKQVTSEIFG